MDWLVETLPGKAAARKLNENIEQLEEKKRRLVEERAAIEDRSAEDLDVTAEAVAGHLAGLGSYLDQFNPGQCKELLEAVVQTVTVEGLARARLRLDLPIRPLGKFDRAGSKWCPIWRPQRDENPNGIAAEFVIVLDRGCSPAKRRGRMRTDGDGRKRSKGSVL